MKHLNIILSLAFLTICLLTTKAQTSVIIDPDNYKTKANPYVIPSLPSGSDYYLSVKGGEPVYITLSEFVKGSVSFYVSNKALTLSSDTVKMEYCGSILINYRKNSNDIYSSAISLMYNYQADIYDRTIGSATYGKRPDFIWVNQGESTTVSGGPNFGYYRWRNMDESIITLGYTDSIKTVTQGNYISETRDAGGILPHGLTRDTISILEKPTFNSTAKTLNFPTTTTGITYKLLKVGSINVTDTTWTETQNFVGDGNAKSISLTNGNYKLTTTFGIHTTVYPYGYFVVGVTTGLDKTKQENINYRLIDNKLQFDKEVNLKFYSLQGQLLQQENGSSFKLIRQAGIFKATDKNSNTLTVKILLK